MGKAISSKFHKMRAEDLKRQVKVYQKKADYKLPASIVKQFDVDELREEGRLCYRLVPKQGFNGTYIMYLYSSRLCFRMNVTEWLESLFRCIRLHRITAAEKCSRCWNRHTETAQRDRTWNVLY